jgi:hypothetical protein
MPHPCSSVTAIEVNNFTAAWVIWIIYHASYLPAPSRWRCLAAAPHHCVMPTNPAAMPPLQTGALEAADDAFHGVEGSAELGAS